MNDRIGIAGIIDETNRRSIRQALFLLRLREGQP